MRTTGSEEVHAVRPRPHPVNATRYRLPAALAAAIVAGILIAVLTSPPFGVLSGWLTGALIIDISTWAAIWHLDAAGTRSHVSQDDPGRRLGGVILVASSVASLGAIGYLLLRPAPNPHVVVVQAVLCVVSVALAWITVHTVFAVRYAHLYYDEPEGGIDFNQQAPPRYTDFAYFAFTIGMSYAVSDTDVGQSEIRRLALQQALISYLLGAVVIGATINLIVSLPG